MSLIFRERFTVIVYTTLSIKEKGLGLTSHKTKDTIFHHYYCNSIVIVDSID